MIQESYGYSFADEDALTQDITVKFYSNASDGTLAYVESGTDDDDNLELSLNINMGIFKNLDKTNKNGKSKNTDEYLDRTLAHELTHAIMAAKDNAFENLPIFMIEGIAELTCGIDDERHDEIIELAQNPDTLLSYLDTTKEESTGTEDYAAGFMFLRYIAQQSSDTTINYTDEVKITGSTKADTIYNYGSDVTISSGKGNDYIESYYSYTDEENVSATVQAVVIDGGAGKDTITTYSDNVSVNGGADNDYITSYSGKNNVILGGVGDDTINGGQHSTINGGKGNDEIERYGAYNGVIKYSSGDGNDTIYGFNSSDTLHIAKGSYTTMISNSDFIVKVGKQKITLKYAVLYDYDKVIIKDSSGNIAIYNDWSVMSGTSGNDYMTNEANNVTVNGGAGNDDITSYGDYVKIFGDDGNDSIDSFYGDNVTISGGKGNDDIYSGGDNCSIDGGAGNDTIYSSGDNTTITGGKGNDSIVLGWDNNIIKYSSGDGKDIIKFFHSDDTLHITKGSYKVKASGNDVIVTVGKGSITLKDAAGQNISIKNSSGKVTTKSYGTYSYDLLEEDNFVTADNISDILAEKSVGAFENTTEKISEENLITFTK